MVNPTQCPDPVGVGCHWCGRKMTARGSDDGLSATEDHRYPWLKGTQSKKANKVVWACRACNELRGTMREANWRAWTARTPNWWLLWRSGCFSGRKQMARQRAQAAEVHKRRG